LESSVYGKSMGINYYSWENDQQKCAECDWVGLGSETTMGDSFADGAEYHCPKCNYYFGYIAYPLLSESLNDPRAPETDCMFAKVVMHGVDSSKKKT
jgi:hypothetical protein